MRKNSALNKHVQEASLFRQRAVIALLVVIACCLILLLRIGYLQLYQHRFYSTLSRQNILSIIPLKPARGLIYDRHGTLLAKNIPTYSLNVVPENVHNLKQTILALQKVVNLTPEEITRFYHYRYRYRPFDPIPIKNKLSEADVDRFYVNQQKFPGILILTSSMRQYPLAERTSDVVGYVGRINQNELQSFNSRNYDASDDIGKNGIEKYYETLLHGKVGSEEAEINATGHIVRILTKSPPIAGKNIYLTIDSKLQKLAHKTLGKENGSIVAIRPQTGEVLALVSHPSFNPNLFAQGISQKDYQSLLDSNNHPLFNRAIHGQFAAGSTVKPFIALASLNQGIIDPKTQVYDPGWYRLPNTKHIYHDWKRVGHGWVNTLRAVEVSCDTFFYDLAVKIGITQLDTMLSQFGFGQKTGIDLPGEQSGLVPSPQWKRKTHQNPWYTGDTIETGIGQGFFLVTPMQLAQATATLANRGIKITPHLLLKTIDENQIENVSTTPPSLALDIESKVAWNTVIKAMRLVVDGVHGTAHYFGHHYGYSVAAKTGTAQIYGHTRDEDRSRTNLPKHLRNNHLFIAFAPIHHPQIAIAIVVEHSANADRMANRIFNYYFKHLKNMS